MAPSSFIDYGVLTLSGKLRPMKSIAQSSRLARALVTLGAVGMLVGAVDPMEGSLIILPGSGLIALGTFLGQGERRIITHRVVVFILIAIGVSALWGLSAVGGIGGKSGHSMWWAVLILPYLIGWLLGIAGPGSPRWWQWLGIVVGLWFLTILGMIITRGGVAKPGSNAAAITIGILGLLTIGGCIWRLRNRGGESVKSNPRQTNPHG